MIHSAVVEFASCGLRWVLEFTALSEVQGLNLDRPGGNHNVVVLSCRDGSGSPVSPKYFTALLAAPSTQAMILSGAVHALVHGCTRLTTPPSGDVRAEPQLEPNAGLALAKYLPAAGFHDLGAGGQSSAGGS